jgi:hypothetical protein
MIFETLRKTYTAEELMAFPAHQELRYKIFAPVLSDLFEDKVVYCEKFICVAQLSDIKITKEGFSATAVTVIPMERDGLMRFRTPEEDWDFSSSWDYMRLCLNSIHVPYAGWRIWPERERVREVIALLAEGKMGEALDLTLYDSVNPAGEQS